MSLSDVGIIMLQTLRMLVTLSGIVGHRWNENRPDSLVTYTTACTKDS
jgi:hypothetical protein